MRADQHTRGREKEREREGERWYQMGERTRKISEKRTSERESEYRKGINLVRRGHCLQTNERTNKMAQDRGRHVSPPRRGATAKRKRIASEKKKPTTNDIGTYHSTTDTDRYNTTRGGRAQCVTVAPRYPTTATVLDHLQRTRGR